MLQKRREKRKRKKLHIFARCQKSWYFTHRTYIRTIKKKKKKKGKIRRRNDYSYFRAWDIFEIETSVMWTKMFALKYFICPLMLQLMGPFVFSWMNISRECWAEDLIRKKCRIIHIWAVWAVEHCMVLVWCYYVTSRYTSSMPGCLGIRCISVMSCMISCLVFARSLCHHGVCIHSICQRLINCFGRVWEEHVIQFPSMEECDPVENARTHTHNQMQFHKLFEPVFLPCGMISN